MVEYNILVLLKGLSQRSRKDASNKLSKTHVTFLKAAIKKQICEFYVSKS